MGHDRVTFASPDRGSFESALVSHLAGGHGPVATSHTGSPSNSDFSPSFFLSEKFKRRVGDDDDVRFDLGLLPG